MKMVRVRLTNSKSRAKRIEYCKLLSRSPGERVNSSDFIGQKEKNVDK